MMPSYYEFFAGGGMVRAGLGPGWRCLFANDFDAKKARCYAANWGADGLCVADVARLSTADLPGRADLAWASFPCQDLSLAGAGAGLRGARSGAFWPFWALMQGLAAESRQPSLVVIENVCGALSSHGGQDFAALCAAFAGSGYRFGALVMDAAQFLPQSRPRLFIVAVRADLPIPPALLGGPDGPWRAPALLAAHARLDAACRAHWVWWSPPPATPRNTALIDVIEDNPASVRWHDAAETARLLAMMSPRNQAKVAAVRRAERRTVGAGYRRTRRGADGAKAQRFEVRFDGLAGCLRTPAGGSSRQLLLAVDGGHVRSRLLSSREAARLMGLPDAYILPDNYNEAYHLTGDGVAAPAVTHLARHVFEPLLRVAD